MGKSFDRNKDKFGNYCVRVPNSQESISNALKLIAKYDVDYVRFGNGIEGIHYYICSNCKDVKCVFSEVFVGFICFKCAGEFYGFMGAVTYGWSCLKTKLSWRQYLAAEAMNKLGWADEEIEIACDAVGVLV